MSGVADLDRLDALLDEIQGIGTSTSPRSDVSNGDYNQYGEEPIEEEPQEEDLVEVQEEPAELTSSTSKTGTVKKRSNSKGAQAKPSSSTASGSKSSKTGTTRSTSSTKKTSSGSSSSKSSTVKKPVTKTKSSSSLAKPVAHNVGDTHIIEVNGQKYDMSTVKIKRAAAPSTLKRTNSNTKPKQSITSSRSGGTVKSKSGTTSKNKKNDIDLDELKREFEDDDLQIYDPDPDKAPVPVRIRKIVREVADTSPLPKLLLTITFVDGSQKKLYATPDFSVQELLELAADKFDVWQSDLFALYDISDGEDKELDPLNSIKMANLHEKSNIRFKVKWFKVPFRWADPTALYFYYTQLCQNVVSEVYPVHESLAVKLAAIQMQVLLGDYQRSKHHVGYFKEKSIEHFLPAFHVKKMTQTYAEQRIFACYTNMTGLSKEEAMKLYIQTARNIPTFGCTFFKGALDGKVYRRFGVSEEGVWVQQDDDRIFGFYSYKDVKMIIKQPTGLQFKFKSGEFFCKLADVHTKTMLELISGYNEILVRQLTDGISRHEFLPKIDSLPEFMYLTPPKPRDEVEVKISPLGAFKNCYLDECKTKDLKPLHKLMLQVDVAYDADKNLDMLDLSKCDINDLHLDAIANALENALKKTSEGIVTLQDMNITTMNLARNKFGTGRTVGRMVTLTKVRVANLKGNNIGNPNCPEGLAAMLKRGNVIEELDISANNITGPGMEVILEQLKGSETLKKLHIGQNKLEPQFCEFISKFLKKANGLTVLTLADNKLGEGVKDLMKGLGTNRTITELDITNIGVTSKTSSLVADWLTSNSTITSFKASYCVLNSSTAERLAKYIEDRYSLLTLHLQDDNLGSGAMKDIVTAMEKNNVIKELMIGGNQIDKKAGLLLGEIVKKNATLKRLGLRNSGLDATGLVAIGGALEVNDQLEFLDLAGNNKLTKKEVIAQWAGTFQKNVSLTELNLAATGIDKSTVSALFANLKYNNKLETLHLDGNKLASGVKELAAVIKTSKIKLLTLQNCGLSCKEVIEFLEALGKCTVEVVDVRMNEYIQKNPQLIQQNVDRFNYLTISF